MKTYKMKKNLHAIVVLLTITLSYAQTKIKSSILQDYDGSVYINDYGYNYEYDLNGNFFYHLIVGIIGICYFVRLLPFRVNPNKSTLGD